jgi:hypothetical protein
MAAERKNPGERGRQTAAALVAALEREKLVARFVDAYIAETKRRGIKDSPLRYRELLGTLGREALLAAVMKLHTALPAHLSRRNEPVLRGPEAAAATAFWEAFHAALGAQLRWTPADIAEFQSDQLLLTQMSAAQPRSTKPGRGAAPGPFADRCALLLDPSMLEKARQAAARFQLEVESLAEKVLAGVFKARQQK